MFERTLVVLFTITKNRKWLVKEEDSTLHRSEPPVARIEQHPRLRAGWEILPTRTFTLGLAMSQLGVK